MPGAHDEGVDADDLARQVDQRTAGIALVDGGVGLNEIFVLVDTAAEHSVFGADDAHGHGLAQAERVADGQDIVAHAQLL